MKRIVLLFGLIGACSADGTSLEVGFVMKHRPRVMFDGSAAIIEPDAQVMNQPDAQVVKPDVTLRPQTCDESGVVFKADDWCLPWDSDSLNALFDECVDGKLKGYYNGLPCPFDVAVAHAAGWDGPCKGCIDGVIITNQGLSTSAAWRGEDGCRYYCDTDGKTVRKM